MKKAFGGAALFFLLCGLLMMGACALQALRVPDLIEYSTLADAEDPQSLTEQDSEDESDPPAKKTVSKLKRALLNLEDNLPDLTKVSPRVAVWGFAPGVALTDKQQRDSSATADLIACGQGYFDVYARLLVGGRLFYPDELKYGDMVAILDEPLALKLFKVPDPIGRKLVIAEKTYLVVGVLRHQKAVGEAAEYAVYLPLMALANQGGQQLLALTLGAVPERGAGALQAMQSASSAWRPGGTLSDTRKAKQMAILMPRWVLGALGIYVLVLLFQALGALGSRWLEQYRARLLREYMVRLIPGVSLRALALLALLALLFGASYLLFQFMVSPVLVFPEWVPQVPVEPEQIAQSFWFIRFNADRMLQLLTPSALRLRFFKDLGVNGALIALFGLALGLMRRPR